MTIQQAKEIETELWHKAVSDYLDKSDFDIYEWLSEKDYKKYNEARQRLG